MRKKTLVTCPICGREISSNQYSKHEKSHLNIHQVTKYTVDHDDLFCKYCNKLCRSKLSVLQHEMKCPHNPDRLVRFKDCSKFLSEEDKEIIRNSKELSEWMDYRQSIQVHVRDLLEYELDNDNNLYEHYITKKASAQGNHVECLLSYHDYCVLVQEARIKSSDIGYKGNCYDLARYNDEGPYAIGNCRFITHSENLKERKLSDGLLKALEKARCASLAYRKENPEAHMKALKVGISNSSYFQERTRIGKAKEELRQANAKKDHSTYGKKSITNGVINKYWDPKSGPIPEGFYLGRTIKQKE